MTPLHIALDYDGTYTADADLWKQFMATSRARGHRVYIVTMRFPHEPVEPDAAAGADAVIYTSRGRKRDHVLALDIEIDIWIDDQPHFIFEDAAGGLLRAWRAWRGRAARPAPPPPLSDPTSP